MRTRSRPRGPWSASPVYFIAFWLAAGFLCIGLPILLTGGR